jgi:hypothetical protein
VTGPLVCILSEGDAPAADVTVASAQGFGLAVVVGVTGQRAVGAFDRGVRVVPVAWRDDFADARNQIVAQVDEPWLLWLDGDERLVRIDAAGLGHLAGDIHGVWIRDRADLTPRPIARLQRNRPGVRWIGAVHETLRGAGDGDPSMADGFAIEHDGYADAAVVRAKLERNRALVAAARLRGEDTWRLALEEARYAEATGGNPFRAWLAAFNHPGAVPARPGDHDGRVEAAEALAAMGYATPARLLLAENQRIVPLRLALLALAATDGGSDEAELAALAALLDGGFDPRYSFPAALAGAGRPALEAWLAARGAERRKARPA